MPFGNPGNTVDIANTVALDAATTTAIGTATNAAGSRLVNPSGALVNHTFTAIGDSVTVDTSVGVSLSMAFTAETNSLPPSLIGSVTIAVTWMDIGLTTVFYTETFEINCGTGFTQITTSITDRILAPRAIIQWIAQSASMGAPNLTLSYQIQNVPVDTRRIVENTLGGALSPGDGLLGEFVDNAVGVGATTGIHAFQLTNGRALIAATSSLAGTFTFGWGIALLQTFVLKTTGAGSDTYFEIPATNRPLVYRATNNGAAAATLKCSLITSND